MANSEDINVLFIHGFGSSPDGGKLANIPDTSEFNQADSVQQFQLGENFMRGLVRNGLVDVENYYAPELGERENHGELTHHIIPNIPGQIQIAKQAILQTLAESGAEPINIIGHSMGTLVSVFAVAELINAGKITEADIRSLTLIAPTLNTNTKRLYEYFKSKPGYKYIQQEEGEAYHYIPRSGNMVTIVPTDFFEVYGEYLKSFLHDGAAVETECMLARVSQILAGKLNIVIDSADDVIFPELADPTDEQVSEMDVSVRMMVAALMHETKIFLNFSGGHDFNKQSISPGHLLEIMHRILGKQGGSESAEELSNLR